MRNKYIKELLIINDSLTREVNLLEKHKNNLNKQLNSIHSSKSYKIWQGFNSVKNENFNIKILINEIIKYKRKSESIKNQNKYIKRVNLLNVNKNFKISVIIPTYNAEPFIEPLLKAILAQKNLEDLEIIIIDSESKDNTRKIAERYGIKFLTIKQKEFNHGLARNIGAKMAKHDLLLFTVQDALPKNNRLFSEMAELLKKDDQIAAVSTVQSPRPDADLFARWQVDNHNKLLNLNFNTITQTKNFFQFEKESFLLKRRVSLLDNVCSLYKKSNLKELAYFKKIDFAEDLDYGLRVLKASYKLGHLCTNGVIHSHNRSAQYFLKRTFLSTQIDFNLLSPVNNKFVFDPTLDLIAGLAISEYLHKHKNLNYISISNFQHFLLSFNSDILNKGDFSSDFSNLLFFIFKELKLKEKKISDKLIYNYFQELVNIINSYSDQNSFVIATNEDKSQFLKKILSTKIGSSLAKHCLGKQTSIVKQNKILLNSVLSGNV